MRRSIVRYYQPVVRWLCQSINEPTIKIAEDRFQITVDVRNFSGEELKVKARPGYVIIEGNQERKTENKLLVSKFVRKFRLPDDCELNKMKSMLSKDGTLTITALRPVCEDHVSRPFQKIPDDCEPQKCVDDMSVSNAEVHIPIVKDFQDDIKPPPPEDKPVEKKT